MKPFWGAALGIAFVGLLSLTVFASPSRESSRAEMEYLVVRVSYPNVVQTEFKGHYKVTRKIKRRTALDSLGEQGWILVNVVESKGGAYCFFARPK